MNNVFIFCTGVMCVLLIEWIYVKVFKSREKEWKRFITECNGNTNNMNWLEEKKREFLFLQQADLVNKNIYTNKLLVINEQIDKLQLSRKQDIVLQEKEDMVQSLQEEVRSLKQQLKGKSIDAIELGKSFSKIDFIRVIYSLHGLGFYNGNIRDTMIKFGNLLGIDLSGYSNDLSQGFSKIAKERQFAIFSRMHDFYTKEYDKRLGKQSK
jgi:hypothetical protein